MLLNADGFCDALLMNIVSFADTHVHAVAAAKQVKIKYKDVRPPVVNIKDAIAKDSFGTCAIPDLVSGDAEGTVISLKSDRYLVL